MVSRIPPLHRKVIRDLWHLRSQMLAVAVVMACGISMFVSLRSMHRWLRDTQFDYYAAYRFADAFAHVRRAPERVRADIARIPGVAGVQTRVVADVTLDVPGMAEPAIGRLISIPENRTPILNDLHLRWGRWISRDPSDVLVSQSFATAHGLTPGDAIPAVLNGRWERLRIVGVAQSPEYVYEIRGLGDVFPDARRFGVLWMGERTLQAAFGMEGAFNDVSVSLGRGAVVEDVLDRLDQLLAPFGSRGAYARADQLSHQFISSEIQETDVTSVLLPAIFLGVTAFLLHLVLARLVTTQREQIAVLKAFGYENRTVALHYMLLALGPILAGAALGAGAGLWFADQLAGVYARFYQFPSTVFRPDWGVVALAFGVSAGAALLGAGSSVAQAVRLPPAEAMRPPAPARFRPGVLERVRIQRRLSPAARMVLRQLGRYPLKAALSSLGIALATATVVTGWWIFDAVDVMKEIQFEQVDRYDLMVTFEEPRQAGAMHALAGLSGVRMVEPFRAVPARLRRGAREWRGGLLGLPRDAQLEQLVDRFQVRRQVPRAGVTLSDILAEDLKLAPGDTVMVEVLEGKRGTHPIVVASVTPDLIGTSATLSLDALYRILGESGTVSGAFLLIDPAVRAPLYQTLKVMPAVSGVAVREAVLQSFDRTIAESFMISISIMVGFASVIAAGVVYNGARVALSERGRELASLRVLGFFRHEVTRLLLGEQLLLTLAGIPVGCGLGYGLAALVAYRFESNLFRIPLVLRPGPYLLGILVVAAATILSALAVRHRIRRLDLIAVLKTRE
jgi:putative ABC transport system permease protein